MIHFGLWFFFCSGSFSRVGARLICRPGGWWGVLPCSLPTERASGLSAALLITCNPSAVLLSGLWPDNMGHTGPEGGDGLCLSLCFASPIASPWKQAQPLRCLCFGQMDACRLGIFLCSPPSSPLWDSKGKVGTAQEDLQWPGAPSLGEP